MVEIYRALRLFLLADATIAASVGTRIYPVKLPQGALYPAITVLKVSEFTAKVLKGKASLARPRYQIDCWMWEKSSATAYTDAQTLGGLVRSRLEGYSGVMSDPAPSPPADYDTDVEYDGARDLFDPDVNGGYFRWSGDFLIWHGVHPVAA